LGGRNGAGKSSLFHVLRKIRAVVYRGAPVVERFPRSDLTRWDTRSTQRYELDLSIAQISYRYRLDIDHGSGADQPPVIRAETLQGPNGFLYGFDGQVQLFREDGSPGQTVVADAARSPLHSIPERADTKLLTPFKEALGQCWWAAPLPPNFE